MEVNNEIKGYYADCYVIQKSRTQKKIEEFLNHFVPNRQATQDEYVINFPEWYFLGYGIKHKIYYDAKDVFECMEKVIDIEYALYFHNQDKTIIRGAMIFYGTDGCTILGLWCGTKYPNTEIEDKVFDLLKEFAKSNEGYITYESPPELDYLAFKKKMERLNSI